MRLAIRRLVALIRTIVRSPVRLLVTALVIAVLVHRLLSNHQAQKKWRLAPIAFIERQCPRPTYATLGQDANPKPKICLTTLTDEKAKAWKTRLMGWRNFDGVLQLTWENKARYVARHGYFLFDGSDLLDKSRPPSWSKILAVKRLLIEEECTWVLWLDADAVIMNSDKKIEDFLPADPTKHLLLSADDGGGYNAGVWLVHNSDWSLQFLEEWWNMKSFVKPTGLAKSGDNDALKYKLKHMEAFDEHILAPPRCTFNSFVKCLEPREHDRISLHVKEADWYMNDAFYHKGDFVAHVAGVDSKVQIIRNLLEEAV
ncbi:hypothetical protein ACA910_008658 [Epithemia clementina (nom. ined.)]